MDCFGQTHSGLKRSANEDQFLIARHGQAFEIRQSTLPVSPGSPELPHAPHGDERQCWLTAVADGRGGHRPGERASRTVLESLAKYVSESGGERSSGDAVGAADGSPAHVPADVEAAKAGAATSAPISPADRLRSAVQESQSCLAKTAEQLSEPLEMATGLTAAYVTPDALFVAHLGNSRCYLLRDGRLQQLTRDHTSSQLYRERETERQSGRDADESPGGELLWKTLSSAVAPDTETVVPQIVQRRLEGDETILLSTDGLNRYLDERQLITILTEAESAQQACRRLVESANRAGGSDNITAVVCRLGPQDSPARKAAGNATGEAGGGES